MTGAIISQFFWKSEHGRHSRFFANGSLFFIKPDLAITAYSNLALSRNNNDMVYAEDYLFFDSQIYYLDSALKLQDGIQCLRIEREMLKEYPKQNITEIHFDRPVSREYFAISSNKPDCSGIRVLCEGYAYSDNLDIREDSDTIDYILLSNQDVEKIKLLRQFAWIEGIRKNDSIYSEHLAIEKTDVIYTTCFPELSMIGGPILSEDGNEVLGMLSHETDDPYSMEGLRGVTIDFLKQKEKIKSGR